MDFQGFHITLPHKEGCGGFVKKVVHDMLLEVLCLFFAKERSGKECFIMCLKPGSLAHVAVHFVS